MNLRFAILLALSFSPLLPVHAASSDILPPARRKPTVDLALALAKPAPFKLVSADLKSPFTPPGFDQPDAAELAARAASAAAASSNKPTSDHDLLKLFSDKLTPSGHAVINGEHVLLFPNKRLHKGDRFVIAYEGRDFELEITDIQENAFSLRLNRAEIIRPIKIRKNP